MQFSITARDTASRRVRAAIAAACLSVLPLTAFSEGFDDTASLAALSLEDLLSMEITTLSRRTEDLADAPAAVHVISQADIQRSGARTIPDLLRMVPGMQVAQIDGNKWAVTARGANGQYANKLLVLMDGRNLYSPLLSGVYWAIQDTDLATIDRIEVVRGPGATMWGANAVNGVVNIITKHAADTAGASISLVSGDRGTVEGTARYGSDNGDFAWRVYGKVFSQDPNVDLAGNSAFDHWDMARIGGRADWALEGGDSLTFTAEAYSSETGDTEIDRMLTPPYRTVVSAADKSSGGFALLRWSGDLEDGSHVQLQTYLAQENRISPAIEDRRSTLDVDLQQSRVLAERHNVMWGVAYRISWDDIVSSDTIQLNPAASAYSVMSAFVQDDVEISENFRVMFGSKFEHSNFSSRDIEIEPSVRFSYRFDDHHSTWGAVSRAVRLPSRGEQDGRIVTEVLPPGNPLLPLPIPTVISAEAPGQQESEVVIAVEAGYRLRSDHFMLDLAVFHNDYDQLRSAAQTAPLCQPSGTPLAADPTCLFTSTHVELPLILGNATASRTVGAELWISRQIGDWWNLQLGYTWIDDIERSSPTQLEAFFKEESPEHQASLRSTMDIGEHLDLDFWVRRVDAYENQGIAAYTAMDARLSWRPFASFEVSAIGRNLLAGRHAEFVSELNDLVPVQIEPEAYLQLRWGF